MEHRLGIVYGQSGPISLSTVFSSLVSSMETTDVAGRDDGEMRSDGVHGLLKTTGMTTAPQFQLQRTSRGWVRRKKKYPLIQIGELERAHRNVVWLTFLSGFCWLAFAHCFPPRCADLGYILYTKPLILEEVKRDVLFDGRDPGSVGNGTAVSSPLTGAIMSPGSKQPFPSVLPEGLAPAGGTPLTRSSAEWHSALQTKSRDEKWDQRDRLSQLPVEESGGLA